VPVPSKLAAPGDGRTPGTAGGSRWRPGLCLALACALAAGFSARAANYEPSRIIPPKPNREFRAAWIATVANLDWPSTNALSTANQKADLVAMLDRAVQLKLNVIIFQVRPACDAMYASTLEPWSEYLTGTMGKAPEPFYDPLEFAIEEAHRRGLELHAWFNPYRARHMVAKSPVAANHISRTHPDLVKKYGKVLWLDPGEPGVQDHSLNVVMDVVKRYDIDGVTFDDYFYPDRTDQDFPDDASWRRFGAGRGQSREDWRRQNVNHFVQHVYASIKSAKPWVKFGISPSGIWRPNNPPRITGKDAYAEYFADSRLWLANGWVDYFSPQLYWPIEPPEHSFPALLKWWAGQNPKGRLLCPAINTYNAGRAWKIEETENQIRVSRKQTGVSGHLHWRMATLMQNHALDEALERRLYAEPALVPAMPWLRRATPEKPKLGFSHIDKGRRLAFDWTPVGLQKPWLWMLQTRTHSEWTTQIFPATRTSQSWGASPPEYVALTAVDRTGNTSRPAVLELVR
jgi:uncharacterized lipoprotein YddW (UPF0748 family)